MTNFEQSTLDPARVSLRLRELTVVDVDVHLAESPGVLAPYCAQPWRTFLEQLAEEGQLGYISNAGFSPNLEPWPSFPPEVPRRMSASTAVEMRGDLDDLGIDVGLLMPHFLLDLAAIRPTDYALDLARAYNRWLVEEWLTEDNGLKGAVIAAPHDPVAAAEEIRRYAGHPHVAAICLPCAAVDPLYGHRRYDPVYDVAQEAGLPLVLHSALSVHPAFPFNLAGFETRFAAHTLSHPFSMMANMASILETGVPVRFPELRFIFTEGGIAWVAFFMFRLDREYVLARQEVPFFEDKPSTYVKRCMVFATQPLEDADRMRDLATFISLLGVDNVVFASDWPHLDFDHPMKALQIPLPDDEVAKVMGANALRVLGLENPRS